MKKQPKVAGAAMPPVHRLDRIKNNLLDLELKLYNHPDEFNMWIHYLDAVEKSIVEMSDAISEQVQKQ